MKREMHKPLTYEYKTISMKHPFQTSGNQELQSTSRDAITTKLGKPVHLIPKMTYIQMCFKGNNTQY